MLYQVDKQYNDQVIIIPVRTRAKTRLAIKVRHLRKPYTYYFDTAPVIEGEDAITVKIPKMPSSVIIELYNEANGNVNSDSTFQVGAIRVQPLRIDFSVNGISDSTVSSFARFSDDFAENAGILSAQNSVYRSPDGEFTVHYKDVIRDDNGRELRTPARINTRTKIIEIAKKYYINYTVPGRKAINWHEFSHLWKNKEQANEMEADKNAILIYLTTGNPTIEAYNVFLKVFHNTPTSMNLARYNALNKFIRDVNKTLTKQIN